MLTNAPKGTKDILPENIYKWQYVETIFKNITKKFGFSEIRTPVFEHTELFARGVGDTTDIVEKQMYTFEDYGGRSLTLRPEGTAGIARAYLENKLFAGVKPTKLWYEIPCFRYEKPQSGRLREFHQFGVEIFGSSDMLADAEVIALADDFLKSLGIKELSLRINSIGCAECRPKYREALLEYIKPHYDELCNTCKVRYEKNPLRIIDCKSPVCGKIVENVPVMIDYLCDECKEDFASLQKNLEALGVDFVIDPMIVRGLDYYTKTAFEFVSESIGAQGTVCGGGRYDKLISQLGGDDTPGVGFGLGVERLLLVMEASGIEIPAPVTCDALIIFMSADAKIKALEILRALRKTDLIVEVDASARNMKGQFKYADRIGAKYCIVLGDDEIASSEATIKNMQSGEQTKVAFDEIQTYLLNN